MSLTLDPDAEVEADEAAQHAIRVHQPRLDFRRDYTGQCTCGQAVSGGFVGHAEHQASHVVRAVLDTIDAEALTSGEVLQLQRQKSALMGALLYMGVDATWIRECLALAIEADDDEAARATPDQLGEAFTWADPSSS